MPLSSPTDHIDTADSRPRAWLLSAYRADSHAAWADWLLASQPQFNWQRLELPGRHFAWRIRGNPLSWLDALPLEQPDLIVATSMVDLATLKGLHPRLAGVPTLYYFHENQFAYPLSHRQNHWLEPQMVQLYGGLAADRLLFNSAFNRDSYLQGIAGLLAQMPDAVPDGVVQRLAQKSVRCPVPIEPVPAAQERDSQLVLWSHRWEHDKCPELFVEAMVALAEEGVEFRLALLGKRPRRTPPALARLRETLPQLIVADGQLPAAEYRGQLGRAAIAVSTARHEFQGLAMLEAASAGAIPLVPDALCYAEQYPSVCRYPQDDAAALVARLRLWLTGGLPPPADVTPWYSASLAAVWAELLAAAPGAGTTPSAPSAAR
ncbi:MAG: glycosyl transferase family 1 [Haliea sp.]|nr:glycosyl transferase family 1 [Haliea sp.]